MTKLEARKIPYKLARMYQEISDELNASMAENRKLHIVMLPWLAFGHMIPYLTLSKLIAQKGHRVSFVSTPKNIHRLPPPPPNLADNNLKYVKIPLPPVKNLPENAEATSDLPYDKVMYLKLAGDALQNPLTEFLEQNSPDWVFFDFAFYWVPEIASKLSIKTAYFSIFTAPFLGFMGPVEALKRKKAPEELTVKRSWIPFETNVRFKIYEILRITGGIRATEKNVSDSFRMGASLENCDAISLRSCSEFEPEWLKLVEDLHRKPVVPVGQLPTVEDDSADQSPAWKPFQEWLDRKEKGSVVYVAFGSEAKPSQDELTEIALGLELSGLPFFWVLRTRRGECDTEKIELPEGFEERTKDHGLVCSGWAPQLKILSHDSVGGFLSHSGWSSVVEAVQFERAMILLPFLADQGINCRVLDAKKIGYPIPRDELSGSFTRNSVADSLRLVLVKEEGRIFREKVKEMKGLFCDPVKQDFYVEHLLAFLQSHKN